MIIVEQLKSLADLAELLEEPIEAIEIAVDPAVFNATQYYSKMFIPKRSGGKRMIAEPQNWLKSVQIKIKERILNRIMVSGAAHGYVKNRSALTNARKHVGKSYLMKIDLRNFFPSIKDTLFLRALISFGFEEQVAKVIVNLCTFHSYKKSVHRCLPQGTSCSPMLSNIAAFNLDKRLLGYCRNHGMYYTRYADDLTFSANYQIEEHKKQIIQIIQDEGFEVNWSKLKYKASNRKQMVTGIVVNDKTNLSKRERRRLRAILYNIEAKKKVGREVQKYNQRNKTHLSSLDFLNHLRGRVAYFYSINPATALKYKQQMERIMLLPEVRKLLLARDKEGDIV